MTRRRNKKVRKLAVALIRVSKGVVVQELGAEAQRHEIEGWAAREGYELIWTEETEEASGGAPLEKRTGLLEAVALVEAQKAQALVFHRMDRFSRDSLVALLVERELARHGARLMFASGGGSSEVGEGPEAVFFRRILTASAELERGLIKARIRAALAVKKRRGELTGSAPYGCRVIDGPMKAGKDGVQRPVRLLEQDPAEQKTIRIARELAADPSSTVRSIQAALTAAGRLNRRGKAFGLEELSKLLRAAEDAA